MTEPTVEAAAAARADGDLSGKVRSGLIWSLLNLAVNKGLSIVSGIILARILVPEDFGVFAIAIAVVNILFGLNDLGLVVAVIRWQGDLRDACRTAMTISTVFSTVLYVALFLAAPAFADVMDAPKSVGVLRLLSLTVFFDGFVAVPHGLLVRQFRQDRLAKIQFVSSPVNFGFSILLGALGFGAWSLAWGSVLGNAVAVVAFFRWSPAWYGFGFDKKTARGLLSFGLPMAGTSVVEYVLLNADYVIVGLVLGPVQAGFYLLAYNISNWIVAALTDAVRPVALAGFVELSKDENLIREKFVKAYALLLTVALPIALAMIVLARSIVGFVYGATWHPSAEALRLLAVLGMVRVAVGLVTDLLVGTGRSRTTLWLQCVWMAALLPALVLGAHVGGIAGVGTAHAAVGVFVAMPLFLASMKRYRISVAELGRSLVRPAVGGLVAATTGLAIEGAVHGDLLRLVVIGPTMLLAYALVVVPRQWWSPGTWKGLVRRKEPEPGGLDDVASLTVVPPQVSGVASK